MKIKVEKSSVDSIKFSSFADTFTIEKSNPGDLVVISWNHLGDELVKFYGEEVFLGFVELVNRVAEKFNTPNVW